MRVLQGGRTRNHGIDRTAALCLLIIVVAVVCFWAGMILGLIALLGSWSLQ